LLGAFLGWRLGPGDTDGFQKRGGEQRLPVGAWCELGDVLRALGKRRGYCAWANCIQELQRGFNAGLREPFFAIVSHTPCDESWFWCSQARNASGLSNRCAAVGG
jgi:hypothetical protein